MWNEDVVTWSVDRYERRWCGGRVAHYSVGRVSAVKDRGLGTEGLDMAIRGNGLSVDVPSKHSC